MAKTTKPKMKDDQVEMVDDDGFLCLKGTLFWKYCAVESNFVRVQMELDAKSAELSALMQKYDDVRSVWAARQALLNEVSVKRSEVLEVQAEVEKLLGVDLKNCAFDDRTGRIHEILPDGVKQPIKATKRRSNGIRK